MFGSTDVFIVGGGPAGLAAAIAARRHGLDVIVADASIPPIDKPCGEGIMPDGLAAARAMGIEIDPCDGYRFEGIRFRHQGDSVQALFPQGAGQGIRRTDLHLAMLHAAKRAGVRFAWGTPVTGISENTVILPRGPVKARWIVGADGGRSRVRKWAGLDDATRLSTRFGFRRHYRVAPWSRFMEIHWGTRGQLYITPIGAEEICLVGISRDPHYRLDQALPDFPELQKRLPLGEVVSSERGAASVTCRLRKVFRGNVALLGDASGSVDAVTGEGLCLAFQQAVALGEALAAGDLRPYAAEHRRLSRRPAIMSDLLLLMDRHTWIRRRAISAMAARPAIFEGLLATHVGTAGPAHVAANSVNLGLRMLFA